MEEVWKPFVRTTGDDWTNVVDAAERKKIQNRLSQRARSMPVVSSRLTSIDTDFVLIGHNLTKGQNHGIKRRPKRKEIAPLHTSPLHEATSSPSEAQLQIYSTALITTPSATSSRGSDLCTGPCNFCSNPDPAADTHFLMLPSMTAYNAFHRIGLLLEIQCSLLDGFHVRASPSKLPPSLAPTARQQVVPHKTFVDILPWPSLRDRILASLTVINEEEFLTGLQECRTWGNVPWDPMGWEVGPEFARKWWFLMDETVLASTNFWRAQRGEKPLILSELVRAAGGSPAATAIGSGATSSST
jgi:hypothetical protein